MPVYLARFGALGPVKIGVSVQVQARLQMLGSRLWEDINLLRLLDGTRADEQALHRRFDHLRLRHEWFRYSPDMMGDLGLPDLRADPSRALTSPRGRSKGTPADRRKATLRDWMIGAGLFEDDLAKLLGVTRTVVAEWLMFGREPRLAISERLIGLSNGVLAETFGVRDWQVRAAARQSAPADAAQ